MCVLIICLNYGKVIVMAFLNDNSVLSFHILNKDTVHSRNPMDRILIFNFFLLVYSFIFLI